MPCRVRVVLFLVTERVFRGELVMCTEPGCAKVPEVEGEPYQGLVKPGRWLVGWLVIARCKLTPLSLCVCVRYRVLW